MGQKRNDVAIIRYFKNEKNYIFWKRHACQSVLVGEGSRSSVDSRNGHTFQCSGNLAVTVVDIEQTDLKAKTVDEVKLVNTTTPTFFFLPDCQLLSRPLRGTILRPKTWQRTCRL